MPFEQVLLILGVITFAGVAASLVVAIVQERWQDRAATAQEQRHEQQVANLNREHSAQIVSLQLEISSQRRLIDTLLEMLQSKKVLTPGDVTKLVTAHHTDHVFDALRELFSADELEVLAHEINIDIEDVGGKDAPKPVLALRILQEAERLGRYQLLRDAVRRDRPNAILS